MNIVLIPEGIDAELCHDPRIPYGCIGIRTTAGDDKNTIVVFRLTDPPEIVERIPVHDRRELKIRAPEQSR